MSWMKRNWDDAGMAWIKRRRDDDDGEDKRNWEDAGMGWIKRARWNRIKGGNGRTRRRVARSSAAAKERK